MNNLLFGIGDYCAGGLTGAVTALAVRAAIGPDMDLAVAMLLGMGLGMVVHLPMGLVLSPVLGMFHVMVPGTLIGMYGGMLFAMRDAMEQGSTAQAIQIGVVFGLIMTAGVRLYDRTLTVGVAARFDSGGR